MTKTALQVLAIIITASGLLAADQPGRSLYQYGNSAAALGRAGTGVSSSGTDLFYLNPAAIADAERLGFGLQYGSLPFPDNYYNPEFSIAVPTSYGTAGLSYRHFHFPDASQFSSGGMLSVGGAKEFTERVKLGIAFNMFYGSSTQGSIYYFGATIGTIYKIKGPSQGKGFGLYDTNAGLSVNFGIPMGSPYSFANFNHLNFGLSTKFYNSDNFNLGIYTDISAIDAYSAFPIKIGFESEIHKKYILRAGGIIPVRGDYNYGDFTLGAGYKFDSENFSGTVNYAFNYYRGGNLVHYVGATFEYGKLDRTPPDTKIKPDIQYISPNNDGIQDQVYFTTDVKDDSRIEGWKLQIIDSNGKAVREFSQSERDIVEPFSLSLFVDRIFARKESLVVPGRIMWDGRNNEGKTLPDGSYTYSFYARDERGNISERKEGRVIVDNTPPEVELSPKDLFFSPNDDGQKDELIISQEIKSEPQDIWHAGFKDSSGKTVKSYKWSGIAVPSKLVWEGIDDNGHEAPEGVYRYFIECRDLAGNSASASITNITLTRAYETADISFPDEYFSYAQNRKLRLKPALSNTAGLEFWKATISDSRKRAVREFTGDAALPPEIDWNGLDDRGNELKDGTYYIKLETRFITGNFPSSYEKKIIFDSTPPKIRISTSPGLFSPDNDGENDILTIDTNCIEDNGISDWKITITDSTAGPFKTFRGKGDIPKILLWDGRGDNRELVESASEYFIVAEATDLVGNRGVSNRGKIDIDILVVVTERGLMMRISNIHFDFDSERLKSPSFKILDRVYTILQKYERYKVEIEGHTDDVGADDYNLRLSERRADSVRAYLVKKGIEPGRLTSVGRGKTVPVYDINKEKDKAMINEMRRKNRRVEFLLIRTE